MALVHRYTNTGEAITLGDGSVRIRYVELTESDDMPDTPFYVRWIPDGEVREVTAYPYLEQHRASGIQLYPATAPPQVGKDMPIAWKILGPVGKDMPIAWQVGSLPVGKDMPIAWAVGTGAPSIFDWPNEPPGMTAIVESDWTEAGTWVSLGGPDQQFAGNGFLRKTADLTIETVSGLPTGTTKALQIVTPQGTEGGFGPWGYHGGGVSDGWGGGCREVYLGYWMRLAGNFYGHASGSNKHANIIGRKPDGRSDSYWNMPWGAGTPARFDLRYDVSAGLSLSCGHSTGTVLNVYAPGVWHLVEMWYRKPLSTAAQGHFRIWVNGALLVDRATICDYGFGATSMLRGIGFHGTWGGRFDFLPQDNIQHFGPFRVAGRTFLG